ncbi:IS110 family transposase, partial [Salmonella enterica subsp. enterica]|nr:IS110 family transposase [Salmonella enterica]EBF8731305.1 IS110 family transposase [Salmonella enterica subsp. enterica]EEF3435233.1 IS110 family transposase [Salmonella enterica subsp. enterica serovar Kalamu]EEJ3975054.1 IS110 family transposase [Salmonella enterica subsp. enterica serovar Ouakam]EAY9025967.1 IS110 family transposase [Salmonella enterica]
MKRFLSYLYRKRKRVFLVTMTLINFVAANQKYYAFNLLSVFIMVFWSVQYLLQHLLVQTQLSDQLLQRLILILQLPQTPQFRHARP